MQLVGLAYWVNVVFMIGGMASWGTWTVPLKMKFNGGTVALRPDVYHLDCTLGSLIFATVVAFALGEPEFVHCLQNPPWDLILWPFLAGIEANTGNFWAVVGTTLAGLVVRYLLSCGTSVPLGTLFSRISQPSGDLRLIMGGVALALCALAFSGLMHFVKSRDQNRSAPANSAAFVELADINEANTAKDPKDADPADTKGTDKEGINDSNDKVDDPKQPSVKEQSGCLHSILFKHRTAAGAVVSIMTGLIYSGWSPLCSLALRDENHKLDPYTLQFVFAIGMTFVGIFTTGSFALWNLTGTTTAATAKERLNWNVYKKTPPLGHLASLLGGMTLQLGYLLIFIAGSQVGMAVSFAIGGCSPLVGTSWGLVFREFKGTSWRVKALLCGVILLYCAAIACIACAGVV